MVRRVILYMESRERVAAVGRAAEGESVPVSESEREGAATQSAAWWLLT